MRIVFVLFFSFVTNASFEQIKLNTENHTQYFYNSAFLKLEDILDKNGSFKDAVFITENSYLKDSLLKKVYYLNISVLSQISKKQISAITSFKNRTFDSLNFKTNYSIFSTLKDSNYIYTDSSFYLKLPFTYNFSDPFGIDDWTNTFVTKLLVTHKGNCRSLAYLYKILADELGAKCWLALAPSHIYIRNYSQQIGWYNTELTSGTFPTDAWIMTTSYTNPEAVMNGLYMDTLSNQQSIAMCVYDLAWGYEYQTHNYYDGFILKCCDLVLKYHPVNPNALLLKAETLKKLYLHEKEIKYPRITATKSEMEATYIKLAKLGYREMPDKMYKKWLKKLQQEKEQNGLKNPKPKKD
jgi:hypothetical protein